MYDIIKLLFDICLFKKGPQDIPYSVNLLRALVIVNGIVGFLIANMRTDWFHALLQSVIGVFLAGGFGWFALFVVGRLARFCQTACALIGADTIIGFFALPGMATMMTGQGGLIVFLVMLGLIAWHWAIIGHVLHHALGESLSFSLGMALLYLLGSYQVMSMLFPEIAGVE